MMVNSELLHQHLSEDLCTNAHLTNTQAVAGDWLLRNLLKKLEPSDGAGASERKEAALTGFLECNHSRSENFALSVDEWSEEVNTVIVRASQFLHRLFPEDEVQLYESLYPCGYGRRASVGVRGVSLAEKLTTSLHYSTTQSRVFFLCAHLSCPPTRNLALRMVRDSRLRMPNITTVPKSVKTDRVICVETLANMFYQQAIRELLEHRLRRIGINLADQQMKQRALAREGSVDGNIATLDLSSASDTIGHSFCRWFLPPGLFNLLDTARSPRAVINGKEEVELKIMSTMGNATTFPLQTLIFYALSVETCRILNLDTAVVGVNGDDIIVPVGAYDLLCRVLSACEFRVNSEKSFARGLFRESCGGDYYDGHDIRAVYIESLSGMQDVYGAFNKLRAWSTHHGIYIPRCLGYLRRLMGPRPPIVPVTAPITSGVWSSKLKGGHYRCYVYRAHKKWVLVEDSQLASTLAVGGFISQPEVIPKGVIRRFGKPAECIFSIDADRGTWEYRKRYFHGTEAKQFFPLMGEELHALDHKPLSPYSGADRWAQACLARGLI